MIQIFNYLQALVGRKDDKGAAMVEYGILVAGIAVLVMVAVFALGPIISNLFTDVGTEITTNTP